MSSHHAVLYTSDAPLTYQLSPDITIAYEYRVAQYGIDDVRALVATAHRRPLGEATTQTLLVATEFITEEAQQALLKIIEEPPQSTRFIFVLQRGLTLLPTLESRFARQQDDHLVSISHNVFQEFLAADIKNRFALIELSVKNKDQVWQQAIKQGLVAFLIQKREVLTLSLLKELEYVTRLLLTRGASNKFLLEHLALNLPLKLD